MTNSNDLFIQASRLALRFKVEFPGRFCGFITVEDLWKLTTAELDTVAVDLHNQLQSTAKISFLKKPIKSDVVSQLKLDIVVYIIGVRTEEQEKAKKATERRLAEQELLELIEMKEKEEKASQSLDDLRGKYRELREQAE